jgi:hypothetical protein
VIRRSLVTVICKIDALEAEYKFAAQDDGNKKCSILFRSPSKKLNVEKVFAGEGLIEIGYTSKNVDPALSIAMHSQRPVKQVWHFDPYLAKDTPARYTTGESGRETLEVTLGEIAGSKLFPCSGFVNGELVGVIRAPAVRVRMMGEDIWAFLLFFENAFSRDSALKFGKNSLSVNYRSSKATATLRADNEEKRKLMVLLNSSGIDFKKLKVDLARLTPGGDELVEQLGELEKGDAASKELTWAPVSRSGTELLWVFPTSMHGHHGALKDAIEVLGAKVNRSLFADGYGKRQMDDFVLADDEKMSYRIDLLMQHQFEMRGPTRGYLLSDSTTMKYVRTNAARKKAANTPEASLPPQISRASSTDLMTKFCSNCNSKIAQSAKFCFHCGQPQEEHFS